MSAERLSLLLTRVAVVIRSYWDLAYNHGVLDFVDDTCGNEGVGSLSA